LFIIFVSKAFEPAALTRLKPLNGYNSILLIIVNKLIFFNKKDDPIFFLKIFFDPEKITSPILQFSVSIIYENKLFSYIILPIKAFQL
jgi:hypothetical protein